MYREVCCYVCCCLGRRFIPISISKWSALIVNYCQFHSQMSNSFASLCSWVNQHVSYLIEIHRQLCPDEAHFIGFQSCLLAPKHDNIWRSNITKQISWNLLSCNSSARFHRSLCWRILRYQSLKQRRLYSDIVHVYPGLSKSSLSTNAIVSWGFQDVEHWLSDSWSNTKEISLAWWVT